MTDRETFQVEEGVKDERLDRFLSNQYPNLSRSYLQSLIKEGFVHLNGSVVKKRTLVRSDDEIEISFPLTKEITLEPENIPLDLLYEDEEILVVNKPAGLVVHPGAGNWSGTFANALLYYLQKNSTKDIRPGIVHRLDKETSGLLIAAKTTLSHQQLVDAFAKRTIKKCYLAIALNTPALSCIEKPIGRDPQKRKKMAIRPDGKPAITEIEVVAKSKELSLLLLRPITGRTHQLRVHLQSIQCPILGDATYGNERINKRYNAKRQFLHALELSFDHPISKKPLHFKAPLPEELETFIQREFSTTNLSEKILDRAPSLTCH